MSMPMSMSMSVSVQETFQEDRLFDERSLGSMQPSDEWGNEGAAEESEFDQYDDVPEDERSFDVSNAHSNAQSTANQDSLDRLKESFFAKQTSLVDYFAELVPTFSVDGSKFTELGRSLSTATFSKLEKAKKTGSSHSRRIIENPESIQDRQDEQRRDDGDDMRDEFSDYTSIEEISQISELTMDMPTVVTEQRFAKAAQCSALPTISEVKEFHPPQIAATCHSGVVSGRAQCVAAADNAASSLEENNDFLDFVFDLVEDAFCKPSKTSKQERKKVFMEAFHEESEKILKLASKNGAKAPVRETSRHSRNSATRHSRSNTGTEQTPEKPKDEEFPMDEGEDPATENLETSVHSTHRSEHSRMKIVDEPPIHPPGYNSAYPLNEELTIDWSKMMSFAEKQLEAEERSVGSHDSMMSDFSGITETPSMFQSVKYDVSEKNDESVLSDGLPPKLNNIAPSVLKSPELSTVSTSCSTHAALPDDVVQELRELSALDSSSFEEESRFLLTSSLFRYVKSKIFGENKKKNSGEMEFEEGAFDEVSVASIPSLSMDEGEGTNKNSNEEDEEVMLRIVSYVAFFYVFVLWPSGVRRKEMPRQTKPKSLLQLVNER